MVDMRKGCEGTEESTEDVTAELETLVIDRTPVDELNVKPESPPKEPLLLNCTWVFEPPGVDEPEPPVEETVDSV